MTEFSNKGAGVMIDKIRSDFPADSMLNTDDKRSLDAINKFSRLKENLSDKNKLKLEGLKKDFSYSFDFMMKNKGYAIGAQEDFDTFKEMYQYVYGNEKLLPEYDLPGFFGIIPFYNPLGVNNISLHKEATFKQSKDRDNILEVYIHGNYIGYIDTIRGKPVYEGGLSLWRKLMGEEKKDDSTDDNSFQLITQPNLEEKKQAQEKLEKNIEGHIPLEYPYIITDKYENKYQALIRDAEIHGYRIGYKFPQSILANFKSNYIGEFLEEHKQKYEFVGELEMHPVSGKKTVVVNIKNNETGETLSVQELIDYRNLEDVVERRNRKLGPVYSGIPDEGGSILYNQDITLVKPISLVLDSQMLLSRIQNDLLFRGNSFLDDREYKRFLSYIKKLGLGVEEFINMVRETDDFFSKDEKEKVQTLLRLFEVPIGGKVEILDDGGMKYYNILREAFGLKEFSGEISQLTEDSELEQSGANTTVMREATHSKEREGIIKLYNFDFRKKYKRIIEKSGYIDKIYQPTKGEINAIMVAAEDGKISYRSTIFTYAVQVVLSDLPQAYGVFLRNIDGQYGVNTKKAIEVYREDYGKQGGGRRQGFFYQYE